MLLGYARVATPDQADELKTQQEALRNAGCTQFFHDVDGEVEAKHTRHRQGLSACLRAATSGDSIVVCSLDRFGSRSDALASSIAILGENNISLKSLYEDIDTLTQSPGSWPLLGFCHSLRDMEEVLQQEQYAQRQAAPRKERRGGRKPLLNSQQVARARGMHQNEGLTVAEVCQKLGISRTTFYRSLNRVSS